MNTKSYIDLFLVLLLFYFFLQHGHHHLDSDIIHSDDELSFYLADSYGIHTSELVFKFNPEDKPYDKQIEKWHKACHDKKGSKLNLLQSQDDHIFGSFLTDTCWEEIIPDSVLTPFIFSLSSSERLLYFHNREMKPAKD
jgi:hypothetical protein